MSNERDGNTKQLIAEAEALTGKPRSDGEDGKGQSTRELVGSAEKLLHKGPSEAPKLSPIPLLIVVLLVIALSILGIYSSYGTSMGGGLGDPPSVAD